MAKIAATTCRTLQEEWCPARHQDEAASAAVLAKCLSARTENSAKSSRTCRLRTQSKSKSSGSRKLAQDSNKSEADHVNDMLKRANLARAVLMDDVDTIQRVISVLRTR